SIPSNSYSISSGTKSQAWTINPKVVTVSWTHSSPYTYDKTAKTVSAAVSNLESGDSASLTITNTGALDGGRYLNHTATDAGLYKAVITAVSNSNYTVSGASGLTLNWQIDKATITGISMSNKTVTYNGAEHTITVSGTATQYSDTVTVVYSIDPAGSASNGAVNAGVYTVDATVTHGNYNNLSLSATLTISSGIMTVITLNDVGSLTFEDIQEPAGTAISAPEVDEDDLLTGYELHWYTDIAFSNEYTFSVMPESNIELWGRWVYIAVDEGFFPYYEEFTSDSISIGSTEELQFYMDFIGFFDLTSSDLTTAQQSVGITYVSGNENIQAEFLSASELCTYATTGGFSLSIAVDSSFKIFVTSSRRSIEATLSAAESNSYDQIGNILYAPHTSDRDSEYNDFWVNEVTMTANVTTTNQLLYVLEHGYKPVPVESSAADLIYSEAKAVLRSIISDSMTDYEKVETIYMWLVMNVAYDYAVLEVELDWQYYDAYYLEGVFNNGRAVCDGIAKALSVMCRIEGIPAVRIEGTGNGGGHAWNKVLLDEEWYVLDATWGGSRVSLSSTYYEMLDFQDFLLTDSEKAAMNCDDNTYTQLIADTEYDFYGEKDLEINGYYLDLIIDSTEELSYLLQYYLSYYSVYGGLYNHITIEFVINYEVGESFNDECSAAIALLTTRGFSWSHNAMRAGEIIIGSVNILFLS
ncbi:MAG: hypothetical protein EOM87_06465, partial [Clostridia bacterium]|nr:hypothetical protein [Clostridia bacterium]